MRRALLAPLPFALSLVLAGCPRAQTSPPAPSVSSEPQASALPSSPPSSAPDPLREAMLKVASGSLPAARALVAASGQPLTARRADAFGSLGGAVWSPEGSHVALRTGKYVRVVDVRSSREVGSRPIPVGFGDERLRLSLGPKGALLALFRSTDDGQVELWDTARGEKLAAFAADVVHGAVEFSPDGATLAFTTRQNNGSRVANTVALVDTRSRQIKATIPTEHLWHMEFVDSGARLRIDNVTYSVDTGEVVSKVPSGLVRGPSGLGVRPSTTWGSVGHRAAVVYDVKSGVDLGPLEAPGCERAEHAFFGPAPRSLVVTLDEGNVCVWDPSTRQLVRRIEVPLEGAPRIALSPEDKVRFTPDGKALLVAVARNEDYPRIHARTYDAASGALVEDLGKVLLLPDPTRPSPSGEPSRLDAWLFDPDRGELLQVSTAAPARRRAVSWKDGEVAFPTAWGHAEATVTQSGLQVFDAGTGQVSQLPAEPGHWTLHPGPDGAWLAAQSDDGLSRVYRLSPRAPTFVTSTAPRPRPIAAVHFPRSGDSLVVASYQAGEERLTLSSGEVRSSRDTLAPPAVTTSSVAFGRDGETVVIPALPETDTSTDLHAAFLPSGRSVTLKGSANGLFGAVALSPDGASLATVSTATGGWDTAEVELWDLSTGKVRTRVHRVGPIALAYDPKGALLATGGTFIPGLELWDARTGKKRFSKPDVSVEQVVFSPDGSTLAYVSSDSTHLLSVSKRSDACVLPPKAGWPIAFSPDGSSLAATTADRSVVLFKTRDCSPLRPLAPSLDEPPVSLAFHPSGKLLAVAFEQGEVRLVPLEGEAREPVVLALSPGAAAAFSSGKIELFGDLDAARKHAVCEASGHVFPFELCEEQSVARGLLAGLVR